MVTSALGGLLQSKVNHLIQFPRNNENAYTQRIGMMKPNSMISPDLCHHWKQLGIQKAHRTQWLLSGLMRGKWNQEWRERRWYRDKTCWRAKYLRSLVGSNQTLRTLNTGQHARLLLLSTQILVTLAISLEAYSQVYRWKSNTDFNAPLHADKTFSWTRVWQVYNVTS